MKVIRHSRIPFIVTLLTLVFLYTPLVIVAIASFNASKYGGDWTHFTWKWYKQLFHEPDIWNALVKTLVIAVISTVISTVLGTLSALALHRSTSKLKAIYYALVHTGMTPKKGVRVKFPAGAPQVVHVVSGRTVALKGGALELKTLRPWQLVAFWR